MFSIFSSMNSQLVQTINGYQQDISAYCAANNINSDTFPLFIALCATTPLILTIEVTQKITESVQKTVAPTAENLIQSTIGLVLPNDIAQSALTLGSQAGSFVQESMQILHRQFMNNPSDSYAGDDNNRVLISDDLENEYVIVKLMGSDPAAPVEATVY